MYPKQPDYLSLGSDLELISQLKHEYGAKGIQSILKDVEKSMKAAYSLLQKLPIDKELAKEEPNKLSAIRRLRPPGPRRIWKAFEPQIYADRLEGALLGRFAGCILGAPVEGWPIERMELLARENEQGFPPDDYWTYVPEPLRKRYDFSLRRDYTRDAMKGVPVDDDLAYTLLGLLVVEDYGPDFSIEDNGKAWIRYLPYACTAEKVALENLKKGIPASRAAERDNPYCEWIGADIRSDPWGYMAPGYPEFAADMAYRDAYVSHRRNGIYGERYFSAVIAAAFAVSDAVEALEIGLTEIPAHCTLAKAMRWALTKAPKIRSYRQARDAVDEKFKGMHPVHTINNACLTIWGLTIGGRDFSKVIGETVAMGLDNDCTGATAGSIAGALLGKSGIPEHWYRSFDNTVHSYLLNRRKFTISGLLQRFKKQAMKVHAL